MTARRWPTSRARYAQTPFTQTWQGDSLTLAIGPVQGDAALTPPLRTYTGEDSRRRKWRR
jgi:hypothetical protein